VLKKVSDDPDRLTEASKTTSPDAWLQCANCGHDITRPVSAIEVNGDHLHTVFNPAGLLFRVRCFRDAPGVVEHGDPTDHFTWFKGYRWRFAHCRGCGQHIGWGYQGEADGFFGLIATKFRDSAPQHKR